MSAEYTRGEHGRQRQARDKEDADALEAARRFSASGCDPAADTYTLGPHAIEFGHAAQGERLALAGAPFAYTLPEGRARAVHQGEQGPGH